jgi:L-aminopeptidase/D-esterase-like protein
LELKTIDYSIIRMGSITDIESIKVGHASNKEAATGCTVILFDKPALGAVDMRGGGTSTRQIDPLLSHNTFGKIHGVLFTGGSAFGLDASSGVINYLEQNKTGLHVGGGTHVPSVPTAVIFDLGIGDGTVRPDKEMGYRACLCATHDNTEEGSVGAGTGATIGKLLGISHATKGGIGQGSFRFENGVTVGVLTVVNAFGDIVSPKTGEVIAGLRDSPQGSGFPGTVNLMRRGVMREFEEPVNTTLALVATDAKLSRAELERVSIMAQSGLSRVISPVHTGADGDLVIAVSTGELKADANAVGSVAAELLADSIVRASQESKGLGGIPSPGDFQKHKTI